ncbi:MAG: nucleoside triphosphate pyrophosphohydrolase [Chloroflexota bacterium]
MTGGQPARVDPAALIAAARIAAPEVALDAGVTLVPMQALSATAIDPRLPLIVALDHGAAVSSARVAADTMQLPGRSGTGLQLLMRLYGAEHVATSIPDGTRATLSSLARALGKGSETIALLIPPLPPLAALASPWAMPWLSARLRAPDGCPWDREQTHGSLAKHLIEEAWELHDAIEALEAAPPERRGEAFDALQGELGDVLLQVILHAQLAAEIGAFDLTDVQERLAKKIVRRHPHVFGDAEATTSRDVQRNWESVKAEERASEKAANGSDQSVDKARPRSALEGVSRSLPALAASRELQDRASALGYDWPEMRGLLEKLDEELGELAEALRDAGDPDVLTGRAAKSPATLAAAKEELGDVIAVLVNLGRRSGIDAEAALRSANEKFRRRFGDVERRAAARAIDLKSADFAVLDGLWDEAKAAERGGGGAK